MTTLIRSSKSAAASGLLTGQRLRFLHPGRRLNGVRENRLGELRIADDVRDEDRDVSRLSRRSVGKRLAAKDRPQNERPAAE